MPITINLNEALKVAEKEIQDELFKKDVEKQKLKLMSKKSFLSIFPYKIIIIKRGK